MATWVLEREVFSDNHDALAEAASDAGATVVGWRDEWWFDGRWPRYDENVIFHGSLGNADRINRELPWAPGAFCSTARFECSSWWPQAHDFLLTQQYAFSTVADLAASGPPANFGGRVFVRPDSPLKPFSGRVLERDRITLSSLDHGFYYDDDLLAVVVAPAVAVAAEWRLVVVDGAVVAGSDYAPVGRLSGSPISGGHPAWEFGAEVARTLEAPEPVFVMDVCGSNAGPRLLELNPFSGADLYGCDRVAIVQAIHGFLFSP